MGTTRSRKIYNKKPKKQILLSCAVTWWGVGLLTTFALLRIPVHTFSSPTDISIGTSIYFLKDRGQMHRFVCGEFLY